MSLFGFCRQCQMRRNAASQTPPDVLAPSYLNRGEVSMETDRRPATRRESWERIDPQVDQLRRASRDVLKRHPSKLIAHHRGLGQRQPDDRDSDGGLWNHMERGHSATVVERQHERLPAQEQRPQEHFA